MYALLAFALLVWVVACIRFERQRVQALRVYWRRACQGRAWRRAFPAARVDEIRTFLRTFTASFGFRNRQALAFCPTDHVLEVYGALYPSRKWPDALELETFAGELETQYGFDLQSVWREDLTLGEVFAMTRAT